MMYGLQNVTICCRTMGGSSPSWQIHLDVAVNDDQPVRTRQHDQTVNRIESFSNAWQWQQEEDRRIQRQKAARVEHRAWLEATLRAPRRRAARLAAGSLRTTPCSRSGRRSSAKGVRNWRPRR